jgi:hypothetical protein
MAVARMIRKVRQVAAIETRDELGAEREERDAPDARWLPIADAAAVLGISDKALRLRMSRQTITTRVDGNGRVDVRIPYDLTGYVRDGVTMPETREEAAANPAPSPQDRNQGNNSDQNLFEIRIDELKVGHAAQLDDLKAIIVELADRHAAEIDRMVGNHRGEVARLMELHQATAKLEAENKKFLLSVISSLTGCK